VTEYGSRVIDRVRRFNPLQSIETLTVFGAGVGVG
jgi:hypothetical protein